MTTTKINWGHKKIIVLVIFCTIITIISICTFRKESEKGRQLDFFSAYKQQCDFSGMSEETRLYANKIYGFSFTYPQDYVVCEIKPSDSSEEYGVHTNLHVMPKKLFESIDYEYVTKHNNTDSLLIEISGPTAPQIPKVEIKQILPSRKIDGIEATIGVANLLQCKKASCPRVVVTRFTRDTISYEFGAVQPFDEVMSTFKFLSEKE